MIISALLLALLGAALGSFAALAAERILRGDPVLFGRSECTSCKRALRAWDLVPIASYLALRGRCRSCHATIPPRLFHAELVGAAFMLSAVNTMPDLARALVLGMWMISLIALTLTDLQAFRLPDPLVIVTGALGLLLALVGDGSGWPDLATRASGALWGALAGAGSFWLIRAGYFWRTGRDGMGLGDVKLMAALGAALGIWLLPYVVLLAAVGMLLVATLRAVRKGRSLSRVGRAPFGAALALSAAVVKVIALQSGF